jgi:hypothetical protein
MSVTDGLLTPAGFDPTSPMIPPTVPMSSGGVTVQGPRVARRLPGQVEIGSNQRIDDALKAQQDAAQAEADAKAAQNKVLAERARREAEIERQSNERLVADAAARDAETKRRQDMYDSEVRGFEKKHGGDQSYAGNHSVTDKLVSAVAVALGGIGMAIARRPGENPVLGVVNSQISEWYDNQNKTLERDREKLARSKTSIEDQSKYFDKRRMQIEAEKQALLTRTAKEFEAQGSLAKNPEIQAQAKQNAAKFALEAEKQREFVMAGQRVDESLPTVSATRTNSAPSANWQGMPDAPKLPQATGPGAQSPITGAMPAVGASNAVGATNASAPPVRMDPNAAAGATNPGDALKKILDAGNKVMGATPVDAAAPKVAVATGAPRAGKSIDAKPATNDDGSLTMPDGSKVSKQVLATSGLLFGHNGAPIGIIRDKTTAEKTNALVHGLADYRSEVLGLRRLAQAVRDAKAEDQADAIAAFEAGKSLVVDKGKIMVGDALSESEKKNVLAADWKNVLSGTVDKSIGVFVKAIDGKVGTQYSAIGIDPRKAIPILYGQQTAQPKAQTQAKTVTRTGTNKQGKRVVQYSDGTIEVQ